MKVSELKDKTTEELKVLLEKTEKSYEKAVSDILQKKEKNVKKASGLRKDIARIKTIVRGKEIEKLNTK